MSIVYVRNGKHLKFTPNKSQDSFETDHDVKLKNKRKQAWNKKLKVKKKVQSQKKLQVLSRLANLEEKRKSKKSNDFDQKKCIMGKDSQP